MKNRSLVILMTVFGFLTLGATAAARAEVTLKFHHDLPEDSAQHDAALKYKEAVESATKREIVVKIFPNNALGDDVEAIQQLQLGALQGAIIPTAKLSNLDPSMQLVDLPFLFP